MNDKDKHRKVLLTTIGVFSLANILCKNEKIGKIIAATGIVTVVAGTTYCVIEEVKDKEEEI